MLRAAHHVLGPDEFRRVCRDRVSKSLGNPVLFAKPARTAMTLFGGSPWAILKATPPSIRYILRGTGDLHVVAEADAVVTYSDVPPLLAQEDAWRIIWEGTLLALGSHISKGTGADVALTLEDQDVASGRFQWRLAHTR